MGLPYRVTLSDKTHHFLVWASGKDALQLVLREAMPKEAVQPLWSDGLPRASWFRVKLRKWFKGWFNPFTHPKVPAPCALWVKTSSLLIKLINGPGRMAHDENVQAYLAQDRAQAGVRFPAGNSLFSYAPWMAYLKLEIVSGMPFFSQASQAHQIWTNPILTHSNFPKGSGTPYCSNVDAFH